MSAGIGYEGSSGRDTSGLANAWGSYGSSFIRRIFNAVVPVTIVERWYGEIEGSLFGLTNGTDGAAGFRPNCVFVSDFTDWELHEVNVAFPVMGSVGATGADPYYRLQCHVYTPIFGFDPVEFNQVGPFGPQLITNTNENQGFVRGFGGVAPTNAPFGSGFTVMDSVFRVGLPFTSVIPQVSDAFQDTYTPVATLRGPLGWDKKLQNSIHFRRPLRIKRGRRLAVGLSGADDTFNFDPVHSLLVSILYNELPNPRSAYRTP